MAPKKQRVAAYLRVSTDRQAEEGLGLEIQEQSVKSWAKASGRLIGLWARDEGVSGSNGLDTREALPEALEAIRDGAVSGIVVYRLDRLARDLIVQETLLAEIRRLGGEVYSTSAAEDGYLADDPDDPSRRLIRQVLGAVSEYERSMIALRLRSGRRRKAENGGYAGGAPAFGFEAKGGALVPSADEQVTLARIRDLHAGGHSLRRIAAVLEEEGHQPKRGKRWHPQSLADIISRL